ncbi:hypothetical protein O1611_g2593 [Lasiodiplodia mahajangana]|uniref:Uncharacterized protein n=1 Tax=Lasiodiplodia mahajangana TaxID=1108764 RepID=A0ACC2JUV1_9PEZI|nr:hypothetical protein O1611_g2593 [Lasiodiplodia mahajangana]
MNYFKLLSACPVVHRDDHVDAWMDGIPIIDKDVGTAKTPPHQPPLDDEPSQDDEPLPNTPSLTNSYRESSIPRGTSGSSRGWKRLGNNGADSVDPEANTQPPLGPTFLRPIAIPRRTTRTKARSTGLIKTRADLQILAKPVHFHGLGEGDSVSLPLDVRSLYFDIRHAAVFQKNIVPYELRGESVLGGHGAIPDHFFCVEASTKDSAEARHMLSTILRIKHQAALSASLQRHDQAWNHLVHTPLLELVFGPEGGLSQPRHDPTVRMEPISFGEITRDSVPKLNSRLFETGSDHGSVLAWSVPESTAEQSVDDDETSVVPAGKAIDYVLVLEIADTAPLCQTISDLILDISFHNDTAPYVNQIDYSPISHSPIAVSIETQSGFSTGDPLLHLGIWIASWHKRMIDLRTWMFLRKGLVTDVSEIQHPKLVSVPLIAAIGHEWEMYFACDTGDSIIIRGPVQLGSTSTILRTFALLASLKAVKKWILNTFYDGLTAWFALEESTPGVNVK